MENFDVCVIGGGPAGASFARELSEKSLLSVCVLEASEKIGMPNKSTSGFLTSELENLRIPKSLRGWRIDSIILEGVSVSAEIPVSCHVSDYTKVVRWLLSEAEKSGAIVRTHSHVLGISKKGKISISGTGEEIGAKFVVDCSGPSSKLAQERGILKRKNLMTGFDVFSSGVSVSAHPRSMVFNFNPKFSPGGYSWIFPTGGSNARAGNCWVEAVKERLAGKEKTHRELYFDWVRSDPRLSGSGILGENGGIAYGEDPKRRVFGNYVAVGDSASTVRPPFGLGIAPAMKAGVLAATLLGENGSFVGFDREMNRIERWKWIFNRFFLEKFYSLPPEKLDRLISALGKLRENEEIERFVRLDFRLSADWKRILSLGKLLAFSL